MDKQHTWQDLYKLADEIKNKHGGVVVIELESFNGSNVGIKLHYFANPEEAAEHIHHDMVRENARFEQGEKSILLHHGGEEAAAQEFIMIDKDQFEQMVDRLKSKMRGPLSPRRSEVPVEELPLQHSRRSIERSRPLSPRRSEVPLEVPPLERSRPLSPRRSEVPLQHSRRSIERSRPLSPRSSLGSPLWEGGLSSRGSRNY